MLLLCWSNLQLAQFNWLSSNKLKNAAWLTLTLRKRPVIVPTWMVSLTQTPSITILQSTRCSCYGGWSCTTGPRTGGHSEGQHAASEVAKLWHRTCGTAFLWIFCWKLIKTRQPLKQLVTSIEKPPKEMTSSRGNTKCMRFVSERRTFWMLTILK